MGKIVALLIIIYGVVMSLVCFFYGVRKIIHEETTFSVVKFIRDLNEFKGSVHSLSGTEILALGVLMLLATVLLTYVIFFRGG